MINEDYIEFKYYNSYLIEKENISPESVVFISQPGQERLIAQGVEYFLVPSNGTDQQVLKMTLSGPVWKNDKEVNTSGSKDLSDIPYNVNVFIPRRDKLQTSITLGVNQDMVDGHECHIIVNNPYDTIYNIVIPDGGKYVNLSSTDTISVDPDAYAEINILSAGGKLYIRAIN